MRRILNQRGSALLYVMFAIVVLAALSPLFLNMVSARSASDITLRNATIANQMTLSAMEAVVTHVNNAMAASTQSTASKKLLEALKQYPSWSNGAYNTIILPEGVKVTHSQWICLDNPSCVTFADFNLPDPTEETIYYIRIRTVAGDQNGNHEEDERSARKKEIFKYVKLKADGSGEPEFGIIDLDDPGASPVCLLPNSSPLLYGGESSSSPSFLPQSQIQSAITNHLNNQTDKTDTIINNYLEKATSCESHYNVSYCTLAQLTNLLHSMDKSKPRIVRVKRINEYVNGDLTSSVSQPVILMVDRLYAASFNTLKLYGDVVVMGEGGIAVDGDKFHLQLHQGRDEAGNNTFGSFYALGNIRFRPSDVEIRSTSGNFYVRGNVMFESGKAVVNVKSITITGMLDTRSTSFEMAASSGNITVGSLSVTGAKVDMRSFKGDLYVKNDLSIDMNNATLNVSGVIAAGNNVSISDNADVTAGGAGTETSLYIPGYSGSCPP